MLSLDEALKSACDQVGILPPKHLATGRWIKADTLSGRNGKGDGRVIINPEHVTAWNWQTGEKITVGLGSQTARVDRAEVAARIRDQREAKRRRAAEAAEVSARMLQAAVTDFHIYLARKGFESEPVLTIAADDVRKIGGRYLVPDGAKKAIIVPARRRNAVTSLQLIWEDGSKKFLAGGEIGGASHRIAMGRATWLCEGLSTGLSLRAALKGIGRADPVLCCFSASNIAVVAAALPGTVLIAADNDPPLPQFSGIGTGEHYARSTGKPLVMPTDVGDDFNDMHMRHGIFAVQKRLAGLIREAKT